MVFFLTANEGKQPMAETQDVSNQCSGFEQRNEKILAFSGWSRLQSALGDPRVKVFVL